MLADLTTAKPDWAKFCRPLLLLPNRAAQKHDYDTLNAFKDAQARYVHLLIENKQSYLDAANECDIEVTKHVLQLESQKLSVLEARLEIYATVLQGAPQGSLPIFFNENRQATDHASKNETHVTRAIVTFKQARMLVDAILLAEIIQRNKLIVDISEISSWDYTNHCYLMLNVFQRGTTQVYRHPVRKSKVQIKYFEASWPGDPVAHRIEPLPQSMASLTKKRLRDDAVDGQQMGPEEYKSMLYELMRALQNYLVLIDDDAKQSALASRGLVRSIPPQQCEDMIGIWLKDLL